MDIIIGCIIIGLIIYLGVQITKFIRLRANVLSRQEYTKAANAQAQKMVYRDPVISCDYCGSKIDTNVHTECPKCGAPYNKDKEWLERHRIDASDINDSTNKIVKECEDKAQQEAKKALARIEKTIFALILIIIVLGFIGIVAYSVAPETSYRVSEELDTFDYYHYKDADYEIVGDGVLYDYDGVKITLTDLFVEDNPYNREKTGMVAAQFHIENGMDKNITISMSCNAVDGLAKDSTFMIMYDKYKKHSDVTVYERINSVPGRSVSEMIFNEIKVYTYDFKYSHKIDEPVVVTTTADTRYEAELEDWVQIFTNDKFDVYVTLPLDYHRDGYKFLAINKTDYDYYLSSDELRVDGMVAEGSTIYKSFIPKGYVYQSNVISSYDEQFQTLSDKEVKISMNFKCDADPAMSFSTGYLDISHTIFN